MGQIIFSIDPVLAVERCIFTLSTMYLSCMSASIRITKDGLHASKTIEGCSVCYLDQDTLGYRPLGRYPFLIGGNAITEDFIVAYWVTPLTAAVGSITLYGIDSAAFHLFHNAHMIR